jgi:hypothetical protein
MKIITGLFLLAVVVSLAIYGYMVGSSWSFVARKPFLVYKYVGAPISSLPVVANVGVGARLEVHECFFDKDDAYVLLQTEDGRIGYSFDRNQVFDRSWQPLHKFRFTDAFNCWRLTSQFGLPRA